MSLETLPFGLYKANIELQLSITHLLQECRQRWLESTQQCNAGAIAETENKMKDLLQSGSWQSLATLSPQTLGRLFEVGLSGTQTMSQTLIMNQTAFTAGLQHALQDWQKAVTELYGSACSAQSLQNIVTPIRETAEPATRRKTAKGA